MENSKNPQTPVKNPDMNGKLISIIESITPSIDPISSEITSYIIRGDMVQFIRKNPEIFHNYYLTGSSKELHKYCETLLLGDCEVGEFELMVLSEVFERPINIYGGREVVCFGATWDVNNTIKLKYDPKERIYIKLDGDQFS